MSFISQALLKQLLSSGMPVLIIPENSLSDMFDEEEEKDTDEELSNKISKVTLPMMPRPS